MTPTPRGVLTIDTPRAYAVPMSNTHLPTRKARRDDVATWAGFRSASFARSTGALVVVVESDAQGLDPDGGGPWATFCEDHDEFVQHETLGAARSFAPAPEQFCMGCQAIAYPDAADQ